jgi:phosphonate transport system substrate-binding protein
MDAITIISLWSDNARPTCQGIADYLSEHAGVRATLVAGVPWQEQQWLLDQGQADVGFICGLPYVRRVERLELLVAPVMRAARYQGRPVYFSDVVVRHGSPFRSFADLRGATWAYNEPGSFSGYAAPRAHLAALGETAGYFGRAVESGAHLRSLELIAAGAVDASAIDTTVLELELRRRPELAAQFRSVETIGPSPIPPVVIARGLAAAVKQRLRDALLHMHEDGEGQDILSDGLLARFVAIHDADYDDIRRKALSAEEVLLSSVVEIASG